MTDFERKLDELARTVAEERQTRRSALKLGLGVLGAAVASAFPARAWAGHRPGHQPDNNSAAAHFCNAIFPEDDPSRGECKSAAAHGEGVFFQCGGDPTRFCVDKCCAAGEVCNPATGECLAPCTPCPPDACCEPGEICCQQLDPDFGELVSSTCVSCPPGQVVNFQNCTCGTPCGPLTVCPEGATCCRGAGSLFGACCFPGSICCAEGGVFGGATCCPPGLPICLRPGGGAVGCGP